MDEVVLKQEKLGHFHDKIHFLYFFDLEHKASNKFLFVFNLQPGVALIFIYYFILYILTYFYHGSFLCYSFKLHLLWRTVKFFVYLIAFVLLCIGIVKNKTYKSYSYSAYVLMLLLFTFNFVMLIFRTWTHGFHLLNLCFLIIDLYFLWIYYSCTIHVEKEQKYLIKGSEPKPNFLKKEYMEIISDSEYVLLK